MKEKIVSLRKNVTAPSYQSDELAQNVSKKTLSDALFLHFSSKVQNLTVFSIISRFEFDFSDRWELIQRFFRAHSK